MRRVGCAECRSSDEHHQPGSPGQTSLWLWRPCFFVSGLPLKSAQNWQLIDRAVRATPPLGIATAPTFVSTLQPIGLGRGRPKSKHAQLAAGPSLPLRLSAGPVKDHIIRRAEIAQIRPDPIRSAGDAYAGSEFHGQAKMAGRCAVRRECDQLGISIQPPLSACGGQVLWQASCLTETSSAR
jgi:hypothetical protein